MSEILKNVVRDMLKTSGLIVLCGLFSWFFCKVFGIPDSIGILLSAVLSGFFVLKT